MSHNIGIIGQGFVGTAVKAGLKGKHVIHTYDKFLSDRSTCTSLAELASKTRIVFVCVPTPMKRTGECDISIVREVCVGIAQARHGNTIVIKSTVPPGTTAALHQELHAEYGVSVLFNPEFLTEAHAIRDFLNQDRIIIGDESDQQAAVMLRRVYAESFPTTPVILTSSTVAEMVKYMTNTFLATKISFANEMYQICHALSVEYDEVVDLVKMDHRIGQTHWQVPGPCKVEGERKFGYSGSCFPKDINALREHAKKFDIKPTMLEAAWKKNLEVRPERDWERLIGRAIVDTKKD